MLKMATQMLHPAIKCCVSKQNRDVCGGMPKKEAERGKGKGRKFWVQPKFSPVRVLLDIERAYIKNGKPKPKVFLFESEQTLTAYPTRNVQKIFWTAKEKAGIKKT
jgi:hypothetical protein